MQDIPVFTTQAGVASLFLNKVAYTGEAYIKLQTATDPKKLLDECADFCKAVGAQQVYAAGHDVVKGYPHDMTLLSMVADRRLLPETDARLVPVRQETLEQWRRIYNEKMLPVPNAAYLTFHKSKQLLHRENSFFVYRHETLLGIGIAADDAVDAVAAVVPGAGQDVLLALCRNLSGNTVHLKVANTNTPAMRLYHRLGFQEEMQLEDWYKII